MNKHKILLFLGFTFGISWLSAGIQYLCGIPYGSGWSKLLTATTIMWGPALAAIIVQKFIYKESFFQYGFRMKSSNKKGWWSLPLVYFGYIFFTLVAIELLGNIFHLPNFPLLDFSHEHLANFYHLVSVKAGIPNLKVPSYMTSGWVMLAVVIAAALLVGPTINLLATFGEEFGWRGALAYETRNWGFWKSGLINGIIWGFWHAPLILQGHNYPVHRIAGVFMMMGLCVGLGYLMSYVRIKTKSVFASAALHGMVNAVAGGMIILCVGDNDLLSLVGVSGIVGCLFVVALIYLLDKTTISQYTEILSEQKASTITNQ